MMKKIVLIFLLASPLVANETGLKTRVVRKKTGDVKQVIAQEFEKMLTSCTSLIALLSEQIDVIVKKLKALASGNDACFSKKNSLQLQQYQRRLEAMRKKCEHTLQEMEQELAELGKDFEHGKD